jgi:FixJ family two-component response regulator
MADKPNCIFIIDDDDSMRRSLRDLLQSLNYDVETFVSAEQFLARKPFHGIGCIILDVRMPGLSGLDLQERLIKAEHPMPIVFITGYGDLPMGVDAMKKGAVDFLPKPFDDEQLIMAVGLALEKGRKAWAEFNRLQSFRECLKTLSPREFDVFRQVITGKLNKQIAAALNIAEQTVKIHRARVMQKMKVDSLAELVRLAENAGIPLPEELK